MTTKVKPIPDGYHSVTPYIIVKNGAKALDFYQKAFNANVKFSMPQSDGRIAHAEMMIGNSHIMLADEFPEMNALSPQTIGGSPITFYVYVEDVDKFFNHAIANGAKEIRPIANQFYGDRSGGLEDPFGHKWYIATHVEDVSEEEVEKRAKEMKHKQ